MVITSAEETIFATYRRQRDRIPVVAVNGLARRAYWQRPGSEERVAIEPGILGLAPDAERIGNAKIDGRWFRLYPGSATAMVWPRGGEGGDASLQG